MVFLDPEPILDLEIVPFVLSDLSAQMRFPVPLLNGRELRTRINGYTIIRMVLRQFPLSGCFSRIRVREGKAGREAARPPIHLGAWHHDARCGNPEYLTKDTH